MKTEQKYYLADLSIYYSMNVDGRINYGPVLENILFCYLKSKGYKLSVGKIGNLECDFIVRQNVDDYFYINGEQVKTYILAEYEGNFYFVGDYRKIVKNTKIWLNAEFVAGKTFADGSMVEVGYHYFDETGKMVY